jgi:hypothetical protein
MYMIDRNNNQRPDQHEEGPKPDAETLHKTDPQEHMEGPVSTPMHKIGEVFDTDEPAGDEERSSSKEE